MTNIFAELSRRNVFRVAAAYIIVGWVILQVVGLLAPSLGLPDWTIALVLIILLAAFPIAVFLTWAIELTPEGPRRTEASEPLAQAKTRKMEIALIAAALLVVLVTLAGHLTNWATNEPPQVQSASAAEFAPRFSVAVLPLNNLSDEAELNWVADGLSEDITTRLASSMNLHVTARNSAFSYKGTSPDVRMVGDELKVRFVLEGSIRKIGTNLRVTLQLIESKTGAHVWTDRYDHALADFDLLQDDVVDVSAAEISGTIQNIEIRELAAMSLDEMEADELAYYSSEIAMTRFSPARFGEALEIANLGLSRDPLNARVHIVLATLYSWSWLYDQSGSQNYQGLADEHMRKALEIAPYSPFVLVSSSNALIALGRTSECLALAEQLMAHHSHLTEAWLSSAYCHIFNGQYDKGLNDIMRWREIAGTRPSDKSGALGHTTEAYLVKGDYQKAVESARTAVAFARTEWPQRNLVSALALNGDIEEAKSERLVYETLPGAVDLKTLTRLRRTIMADDKATDAYLRGLALAGLD